MEDVGWSPVGVHPAAAAAAASVQQPEAVCLIISSPDVTAQTHTHIIFLALLFGKIRA